MIFKPITNASEEGVRFLLRAHFSPSKHQSKSTKSAQPVSRGKISSGLSASLTCLNKMYSN